MSTIIFYRPPAEPQFAYGERLVAADEVLIPVQTEYYSLEGIGQLLETLDLIRNNLQHPIKVSGALITMYDQSESFSRDI